MRMRHMHVRVRRKAFVPKTHMGSPFAGTTLGVQLACDDVMPGVHTHVSRWGWTRASA
jgi:hypothetical protein